MIGGAGFLGSHLVDRLLAEQHGVDVVDDLSTGTLANLAAARASGGELKFHHLDACAPEVGSLVAMREPEVIFHLGWMPPGHRDPATLASAVHSVLNVLEAARALGTAKVVTVLPAAALYGEVAPRDLPVKEGHDWAPIGAAGVITRTVAELLAAYRRQHDVEFSALAITCVYGPRQRADGGVVAAFAAAIEQGIAPSISGDGRQTRDLLYVDDAVDALVRAARRGGGLVINVGTGVLTSIRDLWARMAGPGGAAPSFRPPADDEVVRMSVSPTRARIHLAWAPWTDLDTGLQSLRHAHLP